MLSGLVLVGGRVFGICFGGGGGWIREKGLGSIVVLNSICFRVYCFYFY